MTVLVLGLGQLGQALQALIAARGWPSAVLDHASLDITDVGRVEAAVARYRPWAVVNAAAYNAVDRAETEPDRAMAVNGLAPGHIARAAAAAGAVMVHVSTDYVFDGRKAAAYVESDETGPLGAYGRSKLAGERAVADAGGRHLIVRTAWLFSANGENFVRAMLRRGRERGTVAVVTDQAGSPTPAAGLAEALLTMLDRARAPDFRAWGLYHMAGAPAVTRYHFAEAIFAAAGLGVTLRPTDSAAFPTAAQRPVNAALDCAKAARVFGIAPIGWRAGLDEVIAALRDA